MIKKNKWRLLISSVVILLPIVFGLIMWEVLPEQMVTHWGFSGEADGYSSRQTTVFALPLVMLAIHWICILFTSKDSKNKNQNKKVFRMIFWIVPVISLFVNAAIYMESFGKEFNIEQIELLMIGLMFVIIGNYLPKCKQNHTIGIKVKWALQDEENWNQTHRFCGKVWVVGGVLLMLSVFLPEPVIPYALLIILTILVVSSILYSYLFYKKHLKEGKGKKS